ncbi:hypothetical protein BDW62DRAFT_220576 [Aspergillus aurantiobrunneus]
MSQTSEMYPLGRDEAESRRLNEQHKLVSDLVGAPIDSAVPLDKISTVADVATGTGIWLWDAQRFLNHRAGEADRSFHGFDISPAQFPAPPAGIDFSVHDVLKPFPPEYHNRYDLVHVRMLVTAFVEPEYQTAVDNLFSILKPGGYLQWMELDFSAGKFLDPGDPPAVQLWYKFVAALNISQCAPDVLYKAYINRGLLNVTKRPLLVREHAELRQRAQNWQYQFWSMMMPMMLLRVGEAPNTAQAGKMAKDFLQGLERYFADGNIVDVRFGTVVGQKAT